MTSHDLGQAICQLSLCLFLCNARWVQGKANLQDQRDQLDKAMADAAKEASHWPCTSSDYWPSDLIGAQASAHLLDDLDVYLIAPQSLSEDFGLQVKKYFWRCWGGPKDGQVASGHGEVLEGENQMLDTHWKTLKIRNSWLQFKTWIGLDYSKCIIVHIGLTVYLSAWEINGAIRCQDFSDTQEKDQASRDEKTQRSESEIWCASWVHVDTLDITRHWAHQCQHTV